MSTYGPYRLEVRGTLNVLTAMRIGTGERMDVRTDLPVLRFANAPDGLPYIPGSTLRGVLRQRLEREWSQLGIAKPAYDNLFGVTGKDPRQSWKGRLRVMDCQPLSNSVQTQIQDHVRHNRRWAAADHGAKFDREVALPAEYSFRLLYEGDDPKDEELKLVRAALELLEQCRIRVGGQQGIRRGLLQAVNLRYWSTNRRDPGDLATFFAWRFGGAAMPWPGRTENPIPPFTPGAESTSDVQQEGEARQAANGQDLLPPDSYLRIRLRLQFRGAVLVKAALNEQPGEVRLDELRNRTVPYGELGRRKSDSVWVERAHTGEVYLPGESLRGRLSEAVSYGLLSAGSKSEGLRHQFDVLFGSVKQGDNDGAAGLIEVGDGDRVVGTGRQGYLDHVAIDRTTSFAADQKLFDEAPLESPAFVTTIGVRFTQAQKANLELFFHLLRELFEGFVQAGRGTSRGNGEISQVLAEEIELDLANDINYQPPPGAAVASWYRRRRILLPLAGQWQDIAALAESLTGTAEGVSA